MLVRQLGGASSLIEDMVTDATQKWREGFVPFMSSPYGIAIMFLILFILLNRMRMRL